MNILSLLYDKIVIFSSVFSVYLKMKKGEQNCENKHSEIERNLLNSVGNVDMITVYGTKGGTYVETYGKRKIFWKRPLL